jgi:hypothetical protein
MHNFSKKNLANHIYVNQSRRTIYGNSLPMNVLLSRSTINGPSTSPANGAGPGKSSAHFAGSRNGFLPYPTEFSRQNSRQEQIAA